MSERGLRCGLALGLVVGLAACARPPTALRGEFPATTVADARAAPPVGERVRWGGELVRVSPEAGGGTCFEILSKPLDRRARPRYGDETYGRFVACVAGFRDPAVWAPGREVTAVGTIDGTTLSRVGAYEARVPHVAAAAIHLWPERSEEVRYSPWFGVGGGSGGWGSTWGLGIGF